MLTVTGRADQNDEGFVLLKGTVSAILAGNTGLTKLNALDRKVTRVVLSGANRYTGRTDVSARHAGTGRE